MRAAIEPTWTTALFRPANRYRDLIRERRGYGSYQLPNGETEVELFPDLSPEHVLATGITWEDFCRFLDNKFVWMGPGPDSQPVCQCCKGTRSAAAATATCDFLVRLLAPIKENEAYIGGARGSLLPISGPTLSHFFQESQDNLRQVTLEDVLLNEEQIRALSTTESRPELEVILNHCKLLRHSDCHAAFVECLHRDGGPIQLNACQIDCHVLDAALEGNSRVTRLNLDTSRSDAEKGVIFRSLAENKGLVELDLYSCSISDENWTILCESLKGHPTLTSLVLPNVYTAQRTRVLAVLAAMVEENRVLHTIGLNRGVRDEQIYVESILPHLETNLYRPRVLGIKKADIALRRPLLGLALQTESVRNKSNLIWMFLSGNQDVVLQSDEESAAVLQSDEESVVFQLDEESSEQEEEAATRKRKR